MLFLKTEKLSTYFLCPEQLFLLWIMNTVIRFLANRSKNMQVIYILKMVMFFHVSASLHQFS